MNNLMIPVGYMAKRILNTFTEFKNKDIVDVYSVSGCISKDFADYTQFWKHNGYWLFDSPKIIQQVAKEQSIDLTGTQYFYYEAFHLEFDEDHGWKPFEQEASFTTAIEKPKSERLEGYDIVTFSCGYNPECSPLSCNYLADTITVNEHCLLSSFDDAYELLVNGTFRNSEPGPYRIMAVYSVSVPTNIAVNAIIDLTINNLS